jgi:xanthine dehydrogenase FAD-binding subunit
MYEELKSSTVHTPATLAEYGEIINRFPDAINYAGGTYLVARPDFYPSDDNKVIIDLSNIAELQRITRTDRFVEVGAMVSASQLIDAGRLVLPSILLEALSSIGSTIVCRQITIGGALCIPDNRLSLSTALAVLDAIAEIKIFMKNGKSVTRWIPVSRLYDKEGKLVNFEGRILLTHIRIGLEVGNYQKFLFAGDPFRDGSEAVILAFHAERSSNTLGKVQMCINFPRMAFFLSKEIIGQISGLTLPIPPSMIMIVTGKLRAEILNTNPNIGELPLVRALRMFESVLHDLNTLYLQS